jgi:hypothetical protein
MQRLDNIIHIISRTLNAILLLTQVWTQVTHQLQMYLSISRKTGTPVLMQFNAIYILM